jgi:hypothetical protein
MVGWFIGFPSTCVHVHFKKYTLQTYSLLAVSTSILLSLDWGFLAGDPEGLLESSENTILSSSLLELPVLCCRGDSPSSSSSSSLPLLSLSLSDSVLNFHSKTYKHFKHNK